MTNHTSLVTRSDGNTFADCLTCGWLYESAGTDESSRNAVKRAAEKHEEGAA